MCDVYLCFVTFPCGVLGQMWYLIVLAPDLCFYNRDYAVVPTYKCLEHMPRYMTIRNVRGFDHESRYSDYI